MQSKIILPKLSCKFGAPMGRHNDNISGLCKLQKVTMSSDNCYDNGGAYWGSSITLWVAQDPTGCLAFVRSNTRQGAKELLSNDYNVSFIR